MMFLIRFWRSLTKKDSVESAKYEGKKNFYLYFSFFYVFLRIRIQIFPDQIQILAGLDPDSKKKSDPDPGEKTPDPKHWFYYVLCWRCIETILISQPSPAHMG